MATYKLYSGNGRTTPNGSVTSIDVGTLASLYGLSVSDYITGTGGDDVDYINLRPRLDGKYPNIKNKLHDNGEDHYYDKPAFFNKTRDGKTKNSRVVQPQYLNSFRDDRRTDIREGKIL